MRKKTKLSKMSNVRNVAKNSIDQETLGDMLNVFMKALKIIFVNFAKKVFLAQDF